MDELQRRLLEQGEDASIILTTNSQGKCQTSIYNIHGLRVTGLTAFAESNVPMNILSKIVAGHASVLMTFYYLKHSTAHVSEILSEAHQKIHTISSDEFRKSLKEASIDNLKRKVVANEDYTLDEISSSSLQPDQFFDVGVGLCPKGGAACAEGTRRVGGRYSPVKGGPRNCVQCRFLISGEPWLIPLTLKQQHLIAKTQTLTARHKELDQQSEEAKIARLEAKKAGDTAELTRCRQALKALENEIETTEAHLHDRFADITAVHSLIKSIRELPNSGGGENLPALIAHENFSDHGYGEGTRFQQLDTVLNRPVFTGGQNSRRIACYGT
ncbi:hypothetical protein [Donghicola tyrosinivorans]|uniref:Phage integrase family protein n=1 Tax=Donghicola tyrosinivorans TaxID=1652492 RepID=A0A2T0W684_9RHOB|nr:hypothetical protein [Donghicola tyrosinivorans]PRY82202.1 hypothetical protein CLV74_1531 [Donghicola tyrosinivorans]